MGQSKHQGKTWVVIFLLIAAMVVGIGYYSFNRTMNDADAQSQATAKAAEATTPEPEEAENASEGETQTTTEAAAQNASKITDAHPDDILIGDAKAPVTIIDYSSLSCAHCAHFHADVFPKLKKEWIDTGKVNIIYRHFPLNEPALRAAQLVNCADEKQRQSFLQVLFEKQGDWAFTDSFLKELKKFAALGGVDSAAFDSCMVDKEGENRILAVRMHAAEVGKVNSTPSFFINGEALQGTPDVVNFRAAIKKAGGK